MRITVIGISSDAQRAVLCYAFCYAIALLMPACMASLLCGAGLVVLSACLYVLRMIVYDFASYVFVPALITI